MKAVTMLQFRRDADRVLRRIRQGERLLLTYRGKPAARLEPIVSGDEVDLAHDPFLNVGQRAEASPKGKTSHSEIDRILYGRR